MESKSNLIWCVHNFFRKDSWSKIMYVHLVWLTPYDVIFRFFCKCHHESLLILYMVSWLLLYISHFLHAKNLPTKIKHPNIHLSLRWGLRNSMEAPEISTPPLAVMRGCLDVSMWVGDWCVTNSESGWRSSTLIFTWWMRMMMLMLMWICFEYWLMLVAMAMNVSALVLHSELEGGGLK